jgi:hypothetical protein
VDTLDHHNYWTYYIHFLGHFKEKIRFFVFGFFFNALALKDEIGRPRQLSASWRQDPGWK